MTTPLERIEEIRQKLNKVYLRLAYGKSDIETAKKEVDEILHQELQKARDEAYEHAEIVRQRTLNDIVDMLDEAGDVQGARAVEAMYQSELDQPNK